MSVEARPVRTPASSLRTKSIWPSMRFLISAWIPLTSLASICVPCSAECRGQSKNYGSALCILNSELRSHDRPHRLPHDHPSDVAGRLEIEDQDWQLVVHAERDRRGIHHLQPLLKHLQIRDPLVARGVGMLHRIGGIDAV